MEIEVPEHPIMTWKQFLIHMSTVALGLLMALSLEQTVEWMHHRHQRHQLVEDMRDEAEENIKVIDEDTHLLSQELATLRSVADRLGSAPLQKGFLTIDISRELGPLPQVENMTSPSRGTWAVARDAGLVPLLRHEQARIYTRLDFEAEQELKAEDEATLRYNDLLATLDSRQAPGGQRYQLRLSATDRDLAAQKLRGYMAAQSVVLNRLAFWKGASEAIVHEVRTEDEMMPYITDSATKALK
ncbi:MAG: hypothetical protein PW789_08325 [Edaphobacter sp.]|uniref:hypothetical protein n=1 Tax=Edaphobacter sp. TaxID=1934404 RepID=UPI0023960853|nr:hypothetical protein [Edaphobacter sp.]MDE1176601.1 hypothetical protein [Edaphobacter sp.]